jgi:hypothetical protein
MTQTLTPQQIKNILLGIRESLRLVKSNSGYQNIINSDKFSTSNDLTISDAIQALDDTYQGILDHEFSSQ